MSFWKKHSRKKFIGTKGNVQFVSSSMFALSLGSLLLALRMTSQGAFHLSELTGQAIPVTNYENFTFNQNYPTRSVKSCRIHEGDGFSSTKYLEKAYFILKMTDLAMIWPASSDF